MAACQHPVVGQVDVFPPLNKRFVFSHSSVACKRQNNWASGSPPMIRRETIWSILVARVSPSSFVDGLGCPALEFWNVASSANSRRQSSKGKAVRVGSKELCSNERIFCGGDESLQAETVSGCDSVGSLCKRWAEDNASPQLFQGMFRCHALARRAGVATATHCQNSVCAPLQRSIHLLKSPLRGSARDDRRPIVPSW